MNNPPAEIASVVKLAQGRAALTLMKEFTRRAGELAERSRSGDLADRLAAVAMGRALLTAAERMGQLEKETRG